jgi:hypothetical protein
MRLIDADALKDKVEVQKDDFPCEKEDEFWNMAIDSIIQIIDNAPTVPLPDFKEGYKQAIIDGKTNFAPCYQTTSCLDCKMYDKENHHCPRFCEVIRELVKETEND